MPVVLFDDECLVCNRATQFLLKYGDENIQFAGLSTNYGQQIVKQFGLTNLDSMIVVDEQKVFVESSGIVRVAKYLRGVWQFGRIVWFIPKPLRDVAYRLFAANRHKLPLKQQCILLTPEQRKRFIE